MPGPLSATRTTACPRAATADSVMRVPGGVWRTALTIRLTSTCVSNWRSAWTGSAATGSQTRTCASSSTTGAIISPTSATSSPRSKRAKPARRAPPSTSAMRRIAANMPRIVSLCAMAADRPSRIAGVSARRSSWTSWPRRRASGLRRSCAISLDTSAIPRISSAIRSSMALNACACASKAPPSPSVGTRRCMSPSTIAAAVARIAPIRRSTSRENMTSPSPTTSRIDPKPAR